MNNLKKFLFSVPYIYTIIFLLTFSISYFGNYIDKINDRGSLILLIVLLILAFISIIIIFVEMVYLIVKICRNKEFNSNTKILWSVLTYAFNLFIIPYSYFVILKKEEKYKIPCIIYTILSFISFIIFYISIIFTKK